MRIGNESPIGLATIAGIAPAVFAVAVFLVAVAAQKDLTQAQETTLAVLAAISTVATAGLRQWRAIDPGRIPDLDDPVPGGIVIDHDPMEPPVDG